MRDGWHARHAPHLFIRSDDLAGSNQPRLMCQAHIATAKKLSIEAMRVPLKESILPANASCRRLCRHFPADDPFRIRQLDLRLNDSAFADTALATAIITAGGGLF